MEDEIQKQPLRRRVTRLVNHVLDPSGAHTAIPVQRPGQARSKPRASSLLSGLRRGHRFFVLPAIRYIVLLPLTTAYSCSPRHIKLAVSVYFSPRTTVCQPVVNLEQNHFILVHFPIQILLNGRSLQCCCFSYLLYSCLINWNFSPH